MITFTINRNNFLESIQNIIGVVERRSSSSNQILNHVLIEASEGKIVFTSTDLQVQMTSETTISEKELNFSATAPAKKLYEIARSLDDENISITIEDEGLAINSSSSNFKLKTLPANDFLLFDSIEEDVTFSISQKELRNKFLKTHFAILSSESPDRPYLRGMLIETSPNKLVIYAADGHRLNRSTSEIDKKAVDEARFVVPKKAIQELLRTLTDEGHVKVSFSDNRAFFDMGLTTLTTSLIAGGVPDYTRYMPPEPLISIHLEADRLLSALKRVSILSNESVGGIWLDINNDVITLSSENPEQDSAIETIMVEDTKEQLNIGFKASYLIDAIQACKSGVVSIGLIDNKKGATITTPADPETVLVVMPMRL